AHHERGAQAGRARGLCRAPAGARAAQVRAELHAAVQGGSREEHRDAEGRRAHRHALEGKGSPAAADQRPGQMSAREARTMNTETKMNKRENDVPEKVAQRATVAPAVDIFENKEELL